MNKRKVIMLTITESCNLDCKYCYEADKTNKIMSKETAKKAIMDAFDNSIDFDELEFDFFGGEPSLRKDFIIEIVEWTKKQKFNKPFIFFMETNGTLIHGSFQKWLLENKNIITVGLSIDGTPETHNYNRSNSYNQIDIDFFVKTYPYQGARMTIYPDTCFNLYNDILHLHKLGFTKIDSFFAFGSDWSMDDTIRTVKREIHKLANYYINNPTLKKCSIFDFNILNILKEKEVNKWCGSGTDMCSISVDGDVYPCQIFQPNSIPKTLKTIELEDFELANTTIFSDPSCDKCILEPICPNCYGMNYIATGNMLEREKSLCPITKVRALGVAYLLGKEFKNGIIKLDDAGTYQYIKAIQLIQSNFNLVL